MWHVLHYFAKDWTGWSVIHCIVQCDAVTNPRLNSDETVGCGNSKRGFLKHFSGPGDILPLGCFAIRKINQAHRRHVLYKAHIMFHNSMKHFHQTIQDIQKKKKKERKVPAFDLNYIKRLPK